MKKIIILILLLAFPATALAERGTLHWNQADAVEGNLWVPGSGGETPYVGLEPEAGDCDWSIDTATAVAIDSPVLVGRRWVFDVPSADTMGRHLTLHCKDADSADYVEQFIFFDVPDAPNGKLQACANPSPCPTALGYVKLAASEAAGDNAFRRSTFVTVGGAGAWQSVKICGYATATRILQLCEDLDVPVDNSTYYRIVSNDSDLTQLELAQLRSALGIDGNKTTATGGQLQALSDSVNDVKNKTDLITYNGDNRLQCDIAFVANNAVTGFEDFKDFSTGQGEEINHALGLTGTKVAGTGGSIQTILTQANKMNFTGTDIKATLDGEGVTFADGGITNLKFADNAINARVVATDTFGSDEVAASAAAEMAAGVFSASSGIELATLPSPTPTWGDMLKFIYESGRFKLVTTKTGVSTATQKVYKANGTSVLGTSNVTDNGTSFTRDRYQ